MTDREMLELAAKAAGIKLGTWLFPRAAATGEGLWAPLDDDGDALRLAVKLRINMSFDFGRVVMIGSGASDIHEQFSHDDLAIVRRGVVYAAAEIGSKLET